MDSSEEPFVVWTEEEPLRILVKCKRPADRSMVRKRFRMSIALRGFHNQEDTDDTLVKEFKKENQRDAQFALIIGTMATMRKLIK